MIKKNKLVHIIYISIITILTIAIVVLSIVLIPEKLKSEDPNIQYYNSKCQAFNLQNFNLTEGQIVFIGDSITDLYPLDEYYADLDLATYNRGIGGDTTSGVLKRLKISLFDIKPSKIVLLIGANDVNGCVEKSKILSNYQEILTKIKTELPETQVYCMSMIPQNLTLETYSTIDVEKTTQTILELNPQIEAMVSNEPNFTYLDLFSLLADSNNMLIETYSDDGIHLNAAGFEVWTSLIKPYLI